MEKWLCGLHIQLDFDFSCIQSPPRLDGGHTYALTSAGEGTPFSAGFSPQLPFFSSNSIPSYQA
eukprot:3106450-Rhodomonas_salina.1